MVFDRTDLRGVWTRSIPPNHKELKPMGAKTKSEATSLNNGEEFDGNAAIEDVGRTRYLVMLETNGFGLEIIKSIRSMLFCKAVEYQSCSGIEDYGKYE